MKQKSKSLSLGILGAICIGLILPGIIMADSMSPETFSARITKTESVSVERIVTITEDVTSAKVDVFFLFDTTGSMGDLLDSTKAKATDILNSVSRLGDVAFGIGYYEDFPEGYARYDVPYELVRDITTDSAAVESAVSSLSLGYGGDWLESNLYGLHKAASSTSWREDSTRIIIWFGDAPSHDGDLEPGYPSDVGLADAIAALNAEGIIVEAVNVNRFSSDGHYYSMDEGGAMYSEYSGQATAITRATGGMLLDGSDTDSIVTIINNALKDAFADYSEVRLGLSEEFSGLNVSISPVRITGNFDRSRERTFHFDITYTGAETGIYEFDLLAKVDGGAVAIASDVIEVVFQDCNGDSGGTAFTDNCDKCVGGNTGRTACAQDCNGDWDGSAYSDECGECVGGNTGRTACAQDCNGDWGGSAYSDECGECVGGSTDRTACAQDCNGDLGGSAYSDECGECVGGSTDKIACAQDCNGDWGGSAYSDECDECVGGNTEKFACNPNFTGGVFRVGTSGTVQTDWLYDGGMYRGELAFFSLSGMEDLTPGSEEFIKEAARRGLSNSEEGHLVISDPSEGARFEGSLGSERANRNSGPYNGIKEVSMKPGDTFATILVPNSTLQRLYNHPETTNTHIRPLFSLVSSNPAYGMYLGQIADVNGMGRAFAYEDMDASDSDLDYNDLIIQILGADIDNVPTLDSMSTPDDSAGRSRKKRDDRFDWRKDTELGRLIMEHVETEPESVWISVTLDGSADLLMYDSKGRVIGKDGGYIPGALFGYDADGRSFLSLPGLAEENYRLVIRGAENETGILEMSVMGGQDFASVQTNQVEIQAHGVLSSDITVSSSPGSEIKIGDIKVSPAGVYDFNGDNVVDNADISKVSSKWNLCEGNDEYDAFFDFDDDGCITILDIMHVVNGH